MSSPSWKPTRRWTRRWRWPPTIRSRRALAAPLQTHSRRFWFRYKAETGLAEAAEHHVALIRAILDGDEEAPAAEAERLMALLRGHAEAAARR